MKKSVQRAAVALTAIGLLTGALSGCSASTGSSGSSGGASASGKVAFLMPDEASTRYELQDHPDFVAKMKQLDPGVQVLYQNANGDAAKQQQQANSVITQGAKVLVLDAVDTTAAASIVKTAQSQGVKVITYDRPIVAAKADYYISFNNELIGKLIAQSLITDVKKVGYKSGILIVGGSPTDNAAGLIKKGMLEGVAGSGVPILAKYDTPNWTPQLAQNWVAGQITKFPSKIGGIIAANDGTGGASVAALKAAGVTPIPPVTGNDATIAGIQLIIAGDQYNTILKPITIVASAAAVVADSYLKGKTVAGKTTVFNTPAQVFTPTVVTKAKVKSAIFDGKVYTYSQICTSTYKSACTALGITQ